MNLFCREPISLARRAGFSIFLCLFVSSICLVVQARAAEPQGMAVSTIKAKSACFVDSIQLTGHIEAREEVLVRPDVEGLKISKVLVEDGASVTSGQALAQLVRPEYISAGPNNVTVSAPATGTVLHKTLAIGMPASSRGDPLFRIIRDGDFELVVQVALTEAAKIKPGQTARIEALDGTELAGTVRLIEPQVDPLTQSSSARIQLRSKSGVRLGMFAKASIDTVRVCGATIPLSSILYGPQGSVVQVVRNNHVETKLVKIGPLSGKDAQIQEGLVAGEIVVARAGAFLREGDPVRPVPLEGQK
ncbi:efflux RND transporter periplasmic adaptor subunit [Methyloferula stellata]|uniref:efflux RND transporter periplasmic adaptor subunit n=1 Tax=Methyloferula stellata TaxID=876270 RepID=UPI0003AAA1F2|nr:efflux RND transporter periplasmic adaptor subunit [Methyloferula stellata]